MLLYDMSVSITHDSRLLTLHALHALKYVLVSHGFTHICHGYRRTYLYINSVSEEQRQQHHRHRVSRCQRVWRGTKRWLPHATAISQHPYAHQPQRVC